MKTRSVIIRSAVTIILIALNSTACTKQSWYQGAKSSHQTYCLKLPVSEYDECMEMSDETYDEYSRKRDELSVQKNKNQ